jgi:hypothetical protein
MSLSTRTAWPPATRDWIGAAKFTSRERKPASRPLGPLAGNSSNRGLAGPQKAMTDERFASKSAGSQQKRCD